MHPSTSTILPTPSLHLHQSAASSFLKPILFMFASTYSLYFIFIWPCLHFPSTSCTIAFIKTSFSGCLKAWPYHFIPLLPAYLLLLSIPIYPSAPLYSSCPPTLHHTSFCSSQDNLFSLKHHDLLPYNIADSHSFYIPFLSSAKRIFFQTLSEFFFILLLFLQSLQLHILHWHSTYQQDSKISSLFFTSSHITPCCTSVPIVTLTHL